LGFEVMNQLMIRYSASITYWGIKWEYNSTEHFFLDFEETCVLVWIKLLHNILSDFGVSMKLVILITTGLN